MHVLIVEDDPALREGLSDLLIGAGHTVDTAADGQDGLQQALSPGIDVVVLDLMLPKMDGIQVCKELRAKRPDVYVLMLTAKGEAEDKVKGLKTGADDYMTKPFQPKELLARLEAIERRLKPRPLEGVFTWGDLEIDLGRCVVRRSGDMISLTAKEAGIINLLYLSRGRAVPRGELLEKVWDSPSSLETRTVDMTISNLRQKIEPDPSHPTVIVTIKGRGYAWGEI